jgi:hypothetical protein
MTAVDAVAQMTASARAWRLKAVEEPLPVFPPVVLRHDFYALWVDEVTGDLAFSLVERHEPIGLESPMNNYAVICSSQFKRHLKEYLKTYRKVFIILNAKRRDESYFLCYLDKRLIDFIKGNI